MLMHIGENQTLLPILERLVHLPSYHAPSGDQLKYSRFNSQTTFFDMCQVLRYIPFCEDFGPMNLACVYRFCKMIESRLALDADSSIVVVCAPDDATMTNTVFLIGAYMIMMHDSDPTEVVQRFEGLQHRLRTFRDVSPGVQNFHLHLADCWGGIWRAKQLKWVSFAPNGFELSDYEHCDSPLNADLHEAVPGKLIAMRGPQSIADGAMH